MTSTTGEQIWEVIDGQCRGGKRRNVDEEFAHQADERFLSSACWLQPKRFGAQAQQRFFLENK